jgi:hypothetical protein
LLTRGSLLCVAQSDGVNGSRARRFLIRQDRDIGQADGVVDADVTNSQPTVLRPCRVCRWRCGCGAGAARRGRACRRRPECDRAFDVHVDELARMAALVAVGGLGPPAPRVPSGREDRAAAPPLRGTPHRPSRRRGGTGASAKIRPGARAQHQPNDTTLEGHPNHTRAPPLPPASPQIRAFPACRQDRRATPHPRRSQRPLRRTPRASAGRGPRRALASAPRRAGGSAA